jgi:peptidyl-prolyl cis-trans isomerase B (cyclophilin B)
MTDAIIKTDFGSIKFSLLPDIAPETVRNFVTLTKKGFYDGTLFHRVIPGFMIQGGDPNTKDPNKKSQWGMGGPGHNIKAEFSSRSHLEGIVSMARATDPDSAGSQFFIVTNSGQIRSTTLSFSKTISKDIKGFMNNFEPLVRRFIY